MQPIRPMTDEQFAVLREKRLTMISTLFDGSLVVRDQADELWNLGPSGDLLPHVAAERVRVDAASLGGD